MAGRLTKVGKAFLFIYNAWASVPRQLCTYKLRPVIPAPRRFPDVYIPSYPSIGPMLHTPQLMSYLIIFVYKFTFENIV